MSSRYVKKLKLSETVAEMRKSVQQLADRLIRGPIAAVQPDSREPAGRCLDGTHKRNKLGCEMGARAEEVQLANYTRTKRMGHLRSTALG